MELTDLIVKRKSIRKYHMSSLGSATLAEITELINQIKPLFPDGGKFGFRVVGHDEFFQKTGGLFRIKAPHYILLYGDGSDDAYKNIGYVGELAVLALTKMGLGTCWLGGAKSGETADCGDYAISIAFGKPLAGFRENAGEAKRKALTAIAEGYNDEQRKFLEWVRLAPSAVNSQPWYFKCEPNQIHVFRTKVGGLYSLVAKGHMTMMQKVDIGIALSHFTTREFTYKKLAISDKNMTYEGTLIFK